MEFQMDEETWELLGQQVNTTGLSELRETFQKGFDNAWEQRPLPKVHPWSTDADPDLDDFPFFGSRYGVCSVFRSISYLPPISNSRQ